MNDTRKKENLLFIEYNTMSIDISVVLTMLYVNVTSFILKSKHYYLAKTENSVFAFLFKLF